MMRDEVHPAAGPRTYRFGPKIGGGGFGEVYRATVEAGSGVRRVVAIKLLRDATLVGRLRDEARLLSRLSHPHIVRVEALEQLDDRWAVVMDYVPGRDLRAVRDRGPVPAPLAALWVSDVASALACVHEASDPVTGHPLQALHRDIKPSNIRVGSDGLAYLLDFGSARAEFEDREAWTRQTRFETLGYTAPERHGGEDVAASDVFSLGIVWAELLMGRPAGPVPAHHDLFPQVVERIVTACGPDRPLLARMLAYRPSDRPTAREVMVTLAATAASRPDALRWLAATTVPDVQEDDGPLTGTVTGPAALPQGPTRVHAAGLVVLTLGLLAVAFGWTKLGPEEPAGDTAVAAAAVSRHTNCSIFPPDNPWNQRVDHLPVHPDSERFLASIGADAPLSVRHGAEGQAVVQAADVTVWAALDVERWPAESDPGRYPIPPSHSEKSVEQEPFTQTVVVDRPGCRLYEILSLRPHFDGAEWVYQADAAAIFDLASNTLRPDGWTSADGAGLPIYPGLLRPEEVASGDVGHALRIAVPRSQEGFIHPATHPGERYPATDDALPPPRGLRVRLRADVDCAALPPEAAVVCESLQTYGALVAENGAPWELTGTTDPLSDELVAGLSRLNGSMMEAVLTGPILRR